ncbi:MAG: hypothetical protein QM296_11225 [Bacillota bacterium]|nr:hypothetical protein [Bacillota bacterium]
MDSISAVRAIRKTLLHTSAAGFFVCSTRAGHPPVRGRRTPVNFGLYFGLRLRFAFRDLNIVRDRVELYGLQVLQHTRLLIGTADHAQQAQRHLAIDIPHLAEVNTHDGLNQPFPVRARQTMLALIAERIAKHPVTQRTGGGEA